MRSHGIIIVFAHAVMAVAGLTAEEPPRAPIPLGIRQAIVVPGPGNNLIRNGSFEGSVKYACSSGEWRDPAGFLQVDGHTAAVGQCSALLPKGGGIQIAPFLCKPATLYCLSFYAKGDGGGASWDIGARVRGMHLSDNDHWNEYPGLMGKPRLTRTWTRFALFFPATRLKLVHGVVNSYYAEMWSNHATRWWIDGVQVEEVAGFGAAQVAAITSRARDPVAIPGYPTPYKDAAPVEVCAESIDGPALRLYPPHGTARIRAAISNEATPRTVSATWTLMDHHQHPVWTSPPQTKALSAGEDWAPVQDVKLTQVGALLVRVTVRDGSGIRLNFSDEPVTALPFDNTLDGSTTAERFGINLSFWDPTVKDQDNAGLRLFQRLGFRWVRNAGAPGWSTVEPRPGEWHWTKLEASERFAHEHGFNQFVSIIGEPAWASGPAAHHGNQFPRGLPRDMAAWGLHDPRWGDLTVETAFDRYLRALVIHGRGLVQAYQFGNETTSDEPWGHPATGGVTDPRLAFLLCRRAARIIRSLDPAAEIIGGNILWTKVGYWPAVLRLGGLADMDAFGWDFDCYTVGGTSYATIDGLRRMMRTSAGQVKPTFNYESGWGSGWMQDYSADPIGCDRIDYGAIPDEMARTFAGIFAAGTSHFILHLAGYQRNLMGSYWSCARWPVQLYDEQERPRVTLAPYDVAIHYLGLSDVLGVVSNTATGIEGYAFRDQRQNRAVVVVWSTRDEPAARVLGLTFPGAGLTSADVMGNEMPVPHAAARWRVPILPHRAVTYVLGEPGADPALLLTAFR